MRIIKILIFLSCLQGFSQNYLLTSSERKVFESRVTEKAEEVSSVSADFIQVKSMKALDSEPQSRGRVYYQNPDLLKWEYREPFDYHILFRDSSLFILEEGELSEIDLSSNKLFERMGELVAGTMNGKILKANQDFKVTYHRNNGKVSAQIIPLDPRLSGMFSEIYVSFNTEYLINKVRLIDPSGDYTEILMQNIKINQPIPAAVFQN